MQPAIDFRSEPRAELVPSTNSTFEQSGSTCLWPKASMAGMRGFHTAAEESRRLASPCDLVVYSVAFGPLHDLHVPPGQSEGCAIVFVLPAALKRHGDHLSGWQMIGVHPPMPWEGRYMRRNSRIPKLFPEFFFPKTVSEFKIHLFSEES